MAVLANAKIIVLLILDRLIFQTVLNWNACAPLSPRACSPRPGLPPPFCTAAFPPAPKRSQSP